MRTVSSATFISNHAWIDGSYTQAFHTYRINLSPFTKDFRVWGALIETNPIYLRLPSGSFLNNE